MKTKLLKYLILQKLQVKYVIFYIHCNIKFSSMKYDIEEYLMLNTL